MSGGFPGSAHEDRVGNAEVITFGAPPRQHPHARRLGLASVFVGALGAVMLVAAPAAAPAPEPEAPGITLSQWYAHHDGCRGGELASRHRELRY